MQAEWFMPFMYRHASRFPRTDWEKVTTAFYMAWSDVINSESISESLADAASVKMMLDPPAFLDHHLRAFVAACHTIRLAESTSGSLNGKAAAESSRDCEVCGGNGVLALCIPENRPGMPARLWHYAAFCHVCQYGRFLGEAYASQGRNETPGVKRRILNLRDPYYAAYRDASFRTNPRDAENLTHAETVEGEFTDPSELARQLMAAWKARAASDRESDKRGRPLAYQSLLDVLGSCHSCVATDPAIIAEATRQADAARAAWHHRQRAVAKEAPAF